MTATPTPPAPTPRSPRLFAMLISLAIAVISGYCIGAFVREDAWSRLNLMSERVEYAPEPEITQNERIYLYVSLLGAQRWSVACAYHAGKTGKSIEEMQENCMSDYFDNLLKRDRVEPSAEPRKSKEI